ncbi:superoxide dismutase family protein [Actinomadura rudentiformis]|uniref:Superoxide dismutase family protein n=1 Tax=Actinomadura rudentiformis TaxID=359158 RepID=A0A6H9YDQ1_9ACTN|nr:superoxide dismutase family protein [Actinomadura rudentiformis]KAB2343446.1 superoxide dismutase family protein [Actinomadura rudentiformis]
MPLLRRSAITATAAGAALGLFAAPALAGLKPIYVTGPTYAHDTSFATAKTQVLVTGTNKSTTVRLYVSGLPSSAVGKTLGAHVHANACGPQPADSGPHYQNPNALPGTPLHNKEIWLDLKVRQSGHAAAKARVPWTIAKGAAGSVVVHANPTNHHTGDAGGRLLCTTVPFGS